MKREMFEKILLTVIMVGWYIFMPVVGYTEADSDNMLPHFAYMLSHVNIWHLIGNLLVLWIMRGQLYLVQSVVIAFLASLIPAFSIWGDLGMTLGFSGVLFAIGGIKWGVYCAKKYGRYFSASAFHDFALKALPFALIGILIPHLNWCLHLYALVMGYVYGRGKK